MSGAPITTIFLLFVSIHTGLRPSQEEELELEANTSSHGSCESIINGLTTDQIPEDWSAYLRMGKCLGVGGFGTVYEATVKKDWDASDRPFLQGGAKGAVKMQLCEPSDLVNLKREFAINDILSKNAVSMPLWRVADKPNHNYVISSMQPLAAGDLMDFMITLHARTELTSTTRSVLKLLATADIIEGMRSMLESGVTHNDIKPPNFLVMCDGPALDMKGTLQTPFSACNLQNLRVKYADFGLACTKDGFADRSTACGKSGGACGDVCGTPGWIPPEEMSNRKDLQSPEGDLWAVGSMLYLIWTGHFVPDTPENGWTVLPTPNRTWMHPSEMTSQTGWFPQGDWFGGEGDWNQPGLKELFAEAPHFDVDALPPILDLFGFRQDLSDLMAGLFAAKEERVKVLDIKRDILQRIVDAGACIRKLKPGTPPESAARRHMKSLEENMKSILKRVGLPQKRGPAADEPSRSFATRSGEEKTGKVHEGRSTSDEALQMQEQQGCSLPVATMDELVILLVEAEDAFSSLYTETIQTMEKDERRPWVDRNGVAHYPGPKTESSGVGLDTP